MLSYYSSSVSQDRAHELSVLLSSLLVAEKEPTRVWLRAEMDRLVDPMLYSIFQRLTNKLAIAGWDREATDDDHPLVVDPLDHVETDNHQMHQPSSLNTQPSASTYCHDCNQPHSIGYEPENDPQILAQVKREIKEEEHELALKKVMDKTFNRQFEENEQKVAKNTNHGEVNNVTDNDNQQDWNELEANEIDDGHRTNDELIPLKQNADISLAISNEHSDQVKHMKSLIDGIEGLAVVNQVCESESRSVENLQRNTNQSHLIGHSQVYCQNPLIIIVKQTLPIGEKDQTHEEQQSNGIYNRNNQEDMEEQVTSPPVKRSGPFIPTTLSSTKQTQIITHTLQCSQCGLMFAKEEFDKHLWDRHSICPYRCHVKECGESFTSKLSLGHHLAQSHQSTRQWHCDKCDHHFLAYRLLSAHTTQFHQQGHFQCSFPACTFTGEYRSKVTSHYARQHKHKKSRSFDNQLKIKLDN